MGGGGEQSREKLTPSQEAAAIRQLNAALGVQTRGNSALGLLLGVGIGVILSVGLLLVYGIGSQQQVYGTVVGFGLQETEVGSLPMARVDVDQREALVAIPRAVRCNVGDRIELLRGKSLLGYRYRLGVRGCASG